MSHIKIANHYIHIPYLVLGLIEVVVLLASVFAASYVVFGPPITIEFYWGSELFKRASVFALVLTASTMALGVYQSKAREGFTGMAIRTLAAYCLLGGGGLTLLFYLFPQTYLGKSVLATSIMVALVATLTVRLVFYALVDTESLRRRIVIYGTGPRAAELLAKIESESDNLGLQVIGCIDAGEPECAVDQSRVIAKIDDWLGFVGREAVSEIVIALTERRRGRGAVFPMDDLVDCKMVGVRVIETINFYERELGVIELEHLNQGWMLFSDGFRYSQSRDVIKRGFDIVASLCLLAIIWPFVVLTALAVVLETGRPALYSQIRTGLNGKTFRVYKFRSMVTDAEKDGKAVWATKNDARVTRVGAVIRNTRLDELPQLYNVIRGDMSFVGPRPERPEFVQDLAEQIPFFEQRHRVKPGLMGWAQLKYPYGASVKDAENKLRYDLYYVKNHSILLDFLILVQTVEVVLLGKGVH